MRALRPSCPEAAEAALKLRVGNLRSQVLTLTIKVFFMPDMGNYLVTLAVSSNSCNLNTIYKRATWHVQMCKMKNVQLGKTERLHYQQKEQIMCADEQHVQLGKMKLKSTSQSEHITAWQLKVSEVLNGVIALGRKNCFVHHWYSWPLQSHQRTSAGGPTQGEQEWGRHRPLRWSHII